MYNHNHTYRQTSRPATSGHPAVFIPGSTTTAPPGLSTEFMWECVYDKLPSFQVPLGSTTNKAATTRAVDGGIEGLQQQQQRRHFPPQFDHVSFALDGYPEARYTTRYADINPHASSSEYNRDRERSKMKRMWRDAQLDSSASVSAGDLKAEMDRWRQMEAERGGKSSGQERWTQTNGVSADAVMARHQDAVSKIGYGRAGKGGMVEPVWYEPQVFPVDPRMQKYAHERNVADIGYGRNGRGSLYERIS
ncbi:hypothetical protein BJ741DRAFT_591741 [Chytriomyces cf. hyalinus JEL632]|nr:hypothetical protein BJ741DRAFT_591741 [Chytriomyces cf. hyalinus JEL632]